MNRFGVIDMGTNTFHLLISEEDGAGFKDIYRERIYVQLAEDGIEEIGEAAFARGLNAMEHFAGILEAYSVKRVKAFGTAALRTAVNGRLFIHKVKEYTGIEVHLISGDEEAMLIHRGVKEAVPMNGERRLIMDIGGGSVEFIIATQDEVLWYGSFQVGVAVLFKRFHKNDPLTEEEREAIYAFLEEALSALSGALAEYPTHALIGASGTYDTVEDLLGVIREHPLHSVIQREDFYKVYDLLIHSDLATRRSMEKIPDERVEMIIVALVLIDFVIQKAGIQQITISAYALKEGILHSMF